MSEKLTLDQIRRVLVAIEAAGPVTKTQRLSLTAAVLFASMVGACMGGVFTWRLIEGQSPRLARPALERMINSPAPRPERPKKVQFEYPDDE